MDITDVSEKTSKTFKKAPEMKNIRKDGSFNVEEIIAKQNNTLNLDTHAISRQRRASFGNCLQVNLPITTKKSKSSENLKAPKLKNLRRGDSFNHEENLKVSETESKPKIPVKKKILQRFRSVDESCKDLKSSSQSPPPSKKSSSGLNKLLMMKKATSLDLTTEELLIKQKSQKSKKVNKMAMIPDTNEKDLSLETKPAPKKPTTLTGENRS